MARLLHRLNSVFVRACSGCWSLRDEVDESFVDRVLSIDWTRFQTTHGAATEIPHYLIVLAQNRKSCNAVHQLSIRLCHQNACVTSASAQSLPFLLELLECHDDKLVSHILDLLSAFAYCTNPKHPHNLDGGSFSEFEREIRDRLLNTMPTFRKLLGGQNTVVSDSARSVIKELTGSQPA
jgi:hypothetical protein